MTTAAENSWSFELVDHASKNTFLPNIKIWNVSNHQGLNYQILVSWPLDWTSPEEAQGNALSMYVLDGNALGVTAIEAWRRRAFIEPSQPNGIIVSIGYPLNNSIYSLQRNIDFVPRVSGPIPRTLPGAGGGADDLLDFIQDTLRPFVHSQFPKVKFTRDTLYGHSLGGLFVVYALLRRPSLFDTYLPASPAHVDWDAADVSKWQDEAEKTVTKAKPALRLAYGTLEAHPARRRTDTEKTLQARVDLFAPYDLERNTHAVYHFLKENLSLREAEIRSYPWSDHASLGAVGLTDGIDYFVDW